MLTEDLITVAWTTACIALSLYAFHRWNAGRALPAP
jgi:hypothetical protein